MWLHACAQMDFPQAPGSHRILNVHQNVPGVLRDINAIISNLNANIKAQVRLGLHAALPRARKVPAQVTNGCICP